MDYIPDAIQTYWDAIFVWHLFVRVLGFYYLEMPDWPPILAVNWDSHLPHPASQLLPCTCAAAWRHFRLPPQVRTALSLPLDDRATAPLRRLGIMRANQLGSRYVGPHTHAYIRQYAQISRRMCQWRLTIADRYENRLYEWSRMYTEDSRSVRQYEARRGFSRRAENYLDSIAGITGSAPAFLVFRRNLSPNWQMPPITTRDVFADHLPLSHHTPISDCFEVPDSQFTESDGDGRDD